LDLRGRKWQEAGEYHIMGNFMTCTLYKIKEDEMDGACSTHGRDEKMCTKF
jgi:hypothetical protein